MAYDDLRPTLPPSLESLGLDASARDVVNTGASLVSSQLFESYLECSTKCWLRSRGEPATGNVYAEWVRAQKETYLQDSLKRLLQSLSESDCVTAPPIPKNAKDLTWRLAIDVRWRTRDTGILPTGC